MIVIIDDDNDREHENEDDDIYPGITLALVVFSGVLYY